MRRIGVLLVADRLLLLAPQVGLGLLEDLEEQLLLRVEVPVEDALADAEARHDLGDRGGVVALLGEARGGERHELVAALLAPLGQAPCHGANGTRLDRPVKNARFSRSRSCPAGNTGFTRPP